MDLDGAAARGEHPAVQLVPHASCPNHPQPVPPIYQPEVPAETVYWAAHHRRREVFCGSRRPPSWPTSSPEVADRYLAQTGFKSQQIAGMPVAPGRPDNLFEPVPAWPRPTACSTTRPAHSLQAWLTTHRGAVVGAMGGATVAIAAVGRLVR